MDTIMKAQINNTITDLLSTIDTHGMQQLEELISCYSQLDKGNRSDIVEQAKLYYNTVQLLNKPQSSAQ